MFNFVGFATLILLGISFFHYVLLLWDCGWQVKACCCVITKAPHWWYGCVLLHGPLAVGLGSFIWMLILGKRNETGRVRYAICGFLLIGIAVGYVSAYNWGELNGSEEPSATIRNMALAVTAILGSIFLVWNIRITDRQTRAKERQARAGEQWDRTDSSKVSADRYAAASRMLTDDYLLARIAGIQLLARLSNDDKNYRTMVETLLTHFVESRRSPELLNADSVEAAMVLRRLRNARP